MLEMLFILLIILAKLLLYCIPFVVLFIMPFVIAVAAIIKNKTKLLKVTASVATVISGVAVIFSILFPTAFPYVDWWIYGKSYNEITEAYDGEWNEFGRRKYQAAEYSISDYYSIDFNDQRQATYITTMNGEP